MKYVRGTWLLLVLSVVLAAGAEGPDTEYVRIHTLLQEADTLNQAGQRLAAMAKYTEANNGLLRLQAAFPTWNEKLVSYRTNYIASKLAPLALIESTNAPAGTILGSAATNTVPVIVLLDAERQIQLLEGELERIRANNNLLSAKLKEALSVQPASVDPRELIRAGENTKSLQKENELLRVTLDQEKIRASQTVDPAVLASANQALRDVRSRLDAQTEQLTALKAENETLKRRTDPAGSNVKETLQQSASKIKTLEQSNTTLASEKARLEKQLADIVQQSSATAELRSQLTAAQEELRTRQQQTVQFAAQVNSIRMETGERLQQAGSKIKTLEQTAAALNAEKERLARQVQELSKKPVKSRALEQQLADVKSELKKKGQETAEADRRANAIRVESKQQLQQAERKIKTLEEGNDALASERERLEKQLRGSSKDAGRTKQLEGQLSAAMAELKKRRQVEEELVDLRKKLASANQKASKTQGKALADNRIKELQARLEVLESKPVPYTPEELALFNKPEVALAPATVAPGALTATFSRGDQSKKKKEIPSGAGALLIEAQRAFEARDYPQAEQKYLEVLRQDEANVYTLANLAAIQLEMNHLEDAEKSITQALSLDTEDDFSYYVLGRIKFMQDRLDDAVSALSRSVSLNPNSAETQNYLGIALSEKGLRVPAEIALRKAVQLQPGHAGAHNNLAVVYATQNPPSLALGRWHYQKALASGHPRNPDLEKLLDGHK